MSRDNYPFHRLTTSPSSPLHNVPVHTVNAQPNHYGCDPYNTADARPLRQRLYQLSCNGRFKIEHTRAEYREMGGV